MKKNFTLLIILLFSANLQAYSQTFCQNTRTNSTAGKLENYIYKNYLSAKGKEKRLNIGLVRPIDDLPNKKRPLIIGVHSGGFIDFCPFEPCYAKFSENVLVPNFTAQGFITAAIQYRLTSPFALKPPKIEDETLKDTHYKATQDVREAIKYIFENAEKLGVDTENIFLIGRSSGAITALHAAFLDDEEIPKDLFRKYGGLAKREKIRGVISLSGAIYDLAYLEGGDKVPLMIVHGSEDFIVPSGKGFYLKMKHLTPVFGGKAVFDAAQKKGIDVKGFFYDFGHDYPFRFLSGIFKNANEFIRSHLNCSSNNRPDTTTK
jgi:predicted esterase